MAISSANYGGGNTGAPLDFSPIFQGMAMLGQRREQERLRQVQELNNLVNPLIERWGIQGFAQSGLPFVEDWAEVNKIDLSNVSNIPWSKDQQLRFEMDREQLTGGQQGQVPTRPQEPPTQQVDQETPQQTGPQGSPLQSLGVKHTPGETTTTGPGRTILDNLTTTDNGRLYQPPNPTIVQFAAESSRLLREDNPRADPLAAVERVYRLRDEEVQKIIQDPNSPYSEEAKKGALELSRMHGEGQLNLYEPTVSYLRQNQDFWAFGPEDNPNNPNPLTVDDYWQQYQKYQQGNVTREQLVKSLTTTEERPAVTEVTLPNGEKSEAAGRLFNTMMTERPKEGESPSAFVDRVIADTLGVTRPGGLRAGTATTPDDPNTPEDESETGYLPLLTEGAAIYDYADQLGESLGLENMSPMDVQMLRQTLIDRAQKGEPLVGADGSVSWLREALQPTFIPGLGVVENYAATFPKEVLESPEFDTYLKGLNFYRSKYGTPAEGAARRRLQNATDSVAQPVRNIVEQGEQEYRRQMREVGYQTVYPRMEQNMNRIQDVFLEMARSSPEAAAAYFPEAMANYRQGIEARGRAAEARIREGEARAYEGSYSVDRQGNVSYKGSPEYVARMRTLENELRSAELEGKTLEFYLENFETMMQFEKAQEQLMRAQAELYRARAKGLPAERALEQMRIQGQITEAQQKALADQMGMLKDSLMGWSDVKPEDRQSWIDMNNIWMEASGIPFRLNERKLGVFEQFRELGFFQALAPGRPSVIGVTTPDSPSFGGNQTSPDQSITETARGFIPED